MAWYSGVNGAFWSSPSDLFGSNDGLPLSPVTGTLVHWPFQSGYLLSSKAQELAEIAATAIHIAATSAIEPIEHRWSMTVLLRDDFSSNRHLALSTPPRHLRAR